MQWIEAARSSQGGRTNWHRGDSSFASGWIETDEGILIGAEIIPWLERGEEIDQSKIIGGDYALVRTGNGFVEILSDAVSSIPVFFRMEKGQVMVGPDASLFEQNHVPSSSDFDRGSLASFLTCGMILGRKNMIGNVRRVAAGEKVHLHEENGQVEYFESVNFAKVEKRNEALEKGQLLLEDAIRRSIESIKGRPICVPLSGGMDSRLLVYMLQNLGAENICCFSYGRRSSFESKRSKQIAESLELDWHFVDYNSKLWKAWWDDDRYQDYRKWAWLHSAIEHEQDWPAVLELKRLKLIDEDAVFVPGHSMDFLAGSHLPLVEPTNVSEALLEKYFNLLPRDKMRGGFEELVRQELDAYISQLQGDPFGQFDIFGWKERQSKMIANSVRVYEHHGYDWRLPFWDRDLVQFFMALPFELRTKKNLYLEICENLLPKELYKVPFEVPQASLLEKKFTRLTDRNYSRHGMFSESGIVKAIPTQKIESQIAGFPSDVEGWFEEIKRKPWVSIPFNGQLALRQAIDLFDRQV